MQLQTDEEASKLRLALSYCVYSNYDELAKITGSELFTTKLVSLLLYLTISSPCFLFLVGRGLYLSFLSAFPKCHGSILQSKR